MLTFIAVRNGSATPSVIGLPRSAGSGAFSQCEDVPVEDEGDREPDRECAERDEDARTQLIEMLDKRRLLTMTKAPRQSHQVV